MRVYTLLDRKMREFGSLVLSSNDETLKRALLESLAAIPGSTLSKYPRDFDVMFVGTFDAETGSLLGYMPQLVANVEDVIKGGPDGARAISLVADLNDSVGEVAEG